MQYNITRIFIDNRNRDLFNYLSEKYNTSTCIRFIKSNKITKQNNNITIWINPIKTNKDIFTHELLHAWLWDKGFDFVNDIKIFNSPEYHKNISILFEDNYDYHYSNTIEHILMYPEYRTRGYNDKFFMPKSTFFQNENKIINMIKTLNNNIKKERFFILLLFSTYESEYNGYNFNNIRNALQYENIELYTITNKFIQTIKNKEYDFSTCILFFLSDLNDYYNNYKII